MLWVTHYPASKTQAHVSLLENQYLNLSCALLLTPGAGKLGISSGRAHIAFVLRDVAKKPEAGSLHGYGEIRQMTSAKNNEQLQCPVHSLGDLL